MTRMNLETNDEGQVSGPCTECGLQAHEHDKERGSDGEGRHYWEYHCP